MRIEEGAGKMQTLQNTRIQFSEWLRERLHHLPSVRTDEIIEMLYSEWDSNDINNLEHEIAILGMKQMIRRLMRESRHAQDACEHHTRDDREHKVDFGRVVSDGDSRAIQLWDSKLKQWGRYATWMEFSGQAYRSLLDMDREELLHAARLRVANAEPSLKIARFLEQIAGRLEPEEKVQDRFNRDRLDEIAKDCGV